MSVALESGQMSIAMSLLNSLESRCCDLRCVNVPTGGGDYDVEWVVVEHYMAEPKEREIGRGPTPFVALLSAFAIASHGAGCVSHQDLKAQAKSAVAWLNTDGSPCDGFRFREEMERLREMVSGEVEYPSEK